MSTSLTQQSVPVKYGEFDDGHLTLQQKCVFWGKYRVDGYFEGQHYSGIMFKLAESPPLSKHIHDLYTSFAKYWLPHPQRTDKQAFTIPDVENNMKDNASYQHAAVPSCDSTANTLCICSNILTATDDTYCEDCRSYFNVMIKRDEFRKEKLSELADMKGVNKNQAMKPVPAHNITPAPKAPVQQTSQQVHSVTAHTSSLQSACFNMATHTPQVSMSSAKQTLQGFTPDTNHATPSQPSYTPLQKPTLPSSSPEVISLLTPPPSSPPMPAATPKKKSSKQPFPHKTCRKCKRDFPVNMKKNDGVRCTQCCRQAARENETKPQSSALESLPWIPPPPAPSQSGKSQKRKAEDEVVESIEEAPPASKKVKLADLVVPGTMTVVESIEVASPASKKLEFDDLVVPEDMTEEEKSYYGFNTAWSQWRFS